MTDPSFAGRLAEFRALRHEIEANVLAIATSVDGRRFTFQAPLEPLELRAGGYVELETPAGRWLGQLLSLDVARIDAGEIRWTDESSLSTTRLARGLRSGRGARGREACHRTRRWRRGPARSPRKALRPVGRGRRGDPLDQRSVDPRAKVRSVVMPDAFTEHVAWMARFIQNYMVWGMELEQLLSVKLLEGATFADTPLGRAAREPAKQVNDQNLNRAVGAALTLANLVKDLRVIKTHDRSTFTRLRRRLMSSRTDDYLGARCEAYAASHLIAADASGGVRQRLPGLGSGARLTPKGRSH